MPINKHFQIRRRLLVKSLINLEEGDFKLSFDECINGKGKQVWPKYHYLYFVKKKRIMVVSE